MKVLFYIHQLCVGGAETIVANYLIALKNRGIDVALVEMEASNSFLDERLKTEQIRILSLYPICSNSFLGKIKRKIIRKIFNTKKRWREIIQQESPDIIHSHTTATLLDSIDFPANRIVCSIHTDVERNIRVAGEKNHLALKQLAKKGATFFSLNEKMTADIQTYYQPNRIVYVPNGLELAKIRTKRYDRNSFLSKLNIPLDAFIVGHVGRFHPVKNHSRLIEIFIEVKKMNPRAYLILIGGGSADELQSVSKLVAQCNLTDSVIMLGVREDATAIMSIFDTFVLPSIVEGFSLVAIEAQAQGVRCVVSDVVPDAVICNSNCHSMSLNCSNEEWAKIILSNNERDSTSSIEKFDMKNVIKLMCNEYSRLVKGEDK